MKKVTYLAMFLVLLAASSAHALPSVQSMLFPGYTNNASDNSAEYLINADGSTTDGVGANKTLDVGDRLRGFFNIGTVENTNLGTTHVIGGDNPGDAVSNEWTGFFDITVLTKTHIIGPFYTFTFGPTAGFAAEVAALTGRSAASLAGAMIAMFQDPAINYTRLFNATHPGPDDAAAVAEESLLATAKDGTYFWTLGFKGTPLADGSGTTSVAGEGWTALSQAGDDIAALGAAALGANGGTVNFALNRLDDNSGVLLGLVPSTFGPANVPIVEFNGNGNLLGKGSSSTPVDSFDDLNVDFFVPVPEPGTIVLLGFGLLGLGFYSRRRASR